MNPIGGKQTYWWLLWSREHKLNNASSLLTWLTPSIKFSSKVDLVILESRSSPWSRTLAQLFNSAYAELIAAFLTSTPWSSSTSWQGRTNLFYLSNKSPWAIDNDLVFLGWLFFFSMLNMTISINYLWFPHSHHPICLALVGHYPPRIVVPTTEPSTSVWSDHNPLQTRAACDLHLTSPCAVKDWGDFFISADTS